MPRHEQAAKFWESIKEGDWFLIKSIKGRNYKNLQRWMAFVNFTFDLQDCFEVKEIWRKHLQMLAGHYDEVVLQDGSVQYWPKSIAFDEMSEEEFNKMISNSINMYLSRYGNGITKEQIENAIGFD